MKFLFGISAFAFVAGASVLPLQQPNSMNARGVAVAGNSEREATDYSKRGSTSDYSDYSDGDYNKRAAGKDASDYSDYSDGDYNKRAAGKGTSDYSDYSDGV